VRKKIKAVAFAGKRGRGGRETEWVYRFPSGAPAPALRAIIAYL